MPSDQELKDLVEDWKKKGNDAFGKSELETAVQAYSQGLVQVGRIVTTPFLLKAALLSNRAACYLKQAKLEECRDDCSSALAILDNENDNNLRSKILYRRAKALFLQANMPHKKQEDDLQLAAKDLLNLLSFDSSNKEATKLLNTIRAQHAAESKNTAKTPMAKTLEALRKKDDKMLHNIKVLLGMLTNDGVSGGSELGQKDGVSLLLEICTDESLETKIRYLALQCLSCAGSHPPFCRKYMKEGVQEVITDIMVKSSSNPDEDDLVVGSLTVILRLILHLDRDDPDKEIDGKTFLQTELIAKGLTAAFKSGNVKIIRVAIDVLSSWTAGANREAVILASLDNFVDLPIPLNKYELNQMTPQEHSRYKQRQYQKKVRDRAWAFERSMLLCQEGGLSDLIQCVMACDDAPLRREMLVVVGKLLAALDDEVKIKGVLSDFFEAKALSSDGDKKEERLGPVIEEIDEEEEEKEGQVVDVKEEVQKSNLPVSYQRKMERTVLATALLISKGELGAWALGANAWPSCAQHLDSIVSTNEKNALCLVAELMAAAASVKETRPIVGGYLSNTNLKSLVSHHDKDIRTAAASSVAKLGLSEHETDDIEFIGLLEAACYMLEDSEAEAKAKLSELKSASENLPASATGATSSSERGIEVMTYLMSKTLIKEELAHGFKASVDSEHTGLELLVRACDKPGAGAGLSAFGIASSFQLMAVTPLTLRKEGFEGKQISMEEYDQIKNMQKTDREKDLVDEEPELKEDSPEQCSSRIAKMASSNVPRALMQLTDGASDQTLEQIILALNRMANEVPVRGTMIQQGVLSGLIKLEKEEKTPTDTRKKILKMLRHCIGKMLVTTNPSLLTSAQRMGSIKPLIQLVRDVDSSDLQKFEALMALTNIASMGDETKNKIVAERGIASLKFAMFSEHPMVKQAATECLCNLVPNEKFLATLRDPEEIRLWLALAADYEDHYECARAAAGCLAMATGDPLIADALLSAKTFKARMDEILQSGSLEIMHRMLVVILNLMELGGKYRAAVDENGLLAFARAYVDSYHEGAEVHELEFGEQDMPTFHATVEVSKQIIRAADS